MPHQDPEWMNRARRALDRLVGQYASHPDVSLIDVGYAPEGTREAGQIVLRIHVRERWMKAGPEERVTFPEQVDGIPVVVLPGEHRLHAGL